MGFNPWQIFSAEVAAQTEDGAVVLTSVGIKFTQYLDILGKPTRELGERALSLRNRYSGEGHGVALARTVGLAAGSEIKMVTMVNWSVRQSQSCRRY